MKYKDYLIIPVLVMALFFVSCALIPGADVNSEAAVPDAALDPSEITWGCDDSGLGEYWYANGTRGDECFTVHTDENGLKDFRFYSGSRKTDEPSARGLSYRVDNGHLSCADNERTYDLIFLDDMTAYDTVTGVTYCRADYSVLFSSVTSGKFVNKDNPNDAYVFKESGKSIEFFGEKAFPGRWRFATSDSLSVYDNRTEETFTFDLILGSAGSVSGFSFGGVEYFRET